MRCKTCQAEMSEASAHASIFALSHLPVNGNRRKSFARAKKIKLAEKIGPLCPTCLAWRRDLAG
jgi:hypothetical protein